MSLKNIALFITFLLGLFLVIGGVFAFFLKKKPKVLDFIFAFAFAILLMLILMDLLPEIMELLGIQYLSYFLIFTLVGIFLLKGLDMFILDHHDHKMTKEESKNNISHIGLLTTIALILHNILEGMAIFLAASSDLSLGLMMSIGVGFHNIPLGIIIGSTFYQSETKQKKFVLLMILLCFSSFIGGLIPYLLHINEVNNVVMGSLLSLTLGMLIYIAFFELLARVKESKNKKITLGGFVVGVLVLLLASFIS